MIRLYRAPFSTNVERVALALALKGLPAQSVVIDYADRRVVERVSGQRLVPVLDDDGTIVVGSMAIVRHVDERHPDPPLYPSDRARRAELLIFIDWFDGVWKRAPNVIEAELRRPAPDVARIERAAAALASALDRFESLLAARDHLMGEDFSAADCAAFPFLKYALRRDSEDDELFHRVLAEHQVLGAGHRRLREWIVRVDARPRA